MANIKFTDEEVDLLVNMSRAEMRSPENQARWCVKVYSTLRELPRWRSVLNERELKEVEFCEMYKRSFNHGTPGHNHMILIAILAEELDRLHGMIQPRTQENENQ